MHASQPTLLGHKYCTALDLGVSLTFRFQFVLCKTPRDLPGFLTRPFADRILHHHEALPVCELLDREGTSLGVLLGYGMDQDGTRLADSHDLNISIQDADFEEKLEDWITWLAGRFLVLTDVPCADGDQGRSRRIYPDPAGSLGAVYDPQTGIVASTPLLCLERDIDPDRGCRPPDELLSNKGLRALLPEFDPKIPVGGYGFGSTIDRHLRRVMANRSVDLDTFVERRFWAPDPEMPDLTPAEAADQIVTVMQSMMQAFCTIGPGYFAISGGHDSRMLLACAPDLSTTEMELYCYATNWIGTLDVRVSEALAETLGQPMLGQIADAGPKGSFITNRNTAMRTRQRFALGSGLSHLGDQWWQRGYARQLRQGEIWLRGNFLEIITARVWPRHALTPQDELMHALSNTRVALGDEADVARKLGRFDDWRQSFPMDEARHLHDLTYLDLTLAPAQGAFYGFSSHTYIAPGNNRRIFQLAMQVPWIARKRGELYDAIMTRANPALHRVPMVGMATYRARKLGVPAREYLEQKIAALT
ncbi:hypothetical protein [Shimia sp. Alg240-R146]|uniref:hypothetical protein n=1 Tax=Shimia sp. Alg240-R146 TaxID=2993449 RepID=UPI0022E52D86|nr:hypothetical protein [Shimia sp. Alg240-R146]